MKLNRLILTAALLLPVFSSARAQNESLASIITNADMSGTPEQRTSIIVIQCHGLGYGDLSCYGQTNFATPNLDQLAAEGIRFTNFHPGGTNFTGALNALMSGKNSAASNNSPSIAARLQAAGYHTGLIGEWSLAARPWTCGFDEFVGFLNAEEGRNYFADSLWRFDPNNTYDEAGHRWVDWRGNGPHNAGSEMIYMNTGGQKGKYLPELLVNAMCNFVRINKSDVYNHYKPFFLVVDFPAPRSAKAGADEFPVPSDAPYTDEKWPQAAKNRASLITRVDGGIGRLFAQFREIGLSNNVAIFFTSSEAPEKFKDPKLNFLSPNGKAAAKTGGMAAPLPMIVRWPEGIPAGQVSGFKWSDVDLMPTVLQMSYTKTKKDYDGMSILPVLEGKKGVDLPPKSF